jgi:uncharacterized protein (DUF1501 family)
MNRRQFMKAAAPLGMMPLLGAGLPLRAVSATSPYLPNPCNVTDRSIVIVYLNGGNDIFNTNVPLDQYSEYFNHRPDLAISQTNLITLDSTLPSNQQIGLHPSLTPFKDLYDNGKLAVVQGVGYQGMNRSHFKSKQNWWEGTTGGTEKYNTGWLGRFLDDRYPSYAGIPFTNEPDPLGMLFGNMNEAGFHTAAEHSYEITMSGKDDNGFFSVISSLTGDPIPNIPNTDHGNMLQFLENMAASLNLYAGRVQQVFNAGTNDGNINYPDTQLGNQLKTVAKLLSGGSRTKIFMVSKGGFDNHANLINIGNTTQGKHADLLSDTFTSIKAFQDDLTAQGLDNNVLTYVFSEFGRKVIQNGSSGCDHGSLSNMFIIGKGVQPGVIGNNMDLTDLHKGAPSNSQMQHSYHKVYATLLQDWLGAGDSSIDNNIFSNATVPYSTQKLNLINTSSIVPPSCYFTPIPVTGCACMQVKVFLEGFYDTNAGEMKTDLGSSANFPTTQPYNTAPFNYSGTESFSTLPPDTVDWLLLELRDANDFSNVIERQAVLVRKDGFVIQTDGTLGANFANVNVGNYHLAVFHRNHLAILSANKVELDNTTLVQDFTLSTSSAFGQNQLKSIGGKFALFAGDISANHIIDNADYNYHQTNQGSGIGYDKGDLNGDENIDAADYDLWFENRYKFGQVQ